MSFLKQFLEGLGAFVSLFLLWHPSLLLRQGLWKLPATTYHFLHKCFLFPSQPSTCADHGAPHSSSMQGTGFKVKKTDLTGHFPILCATRCKHLYHFPNLCICNLLVARLSRLRSPAGTTNSAGQAMVRPRDVSWRINAAARFLFCFHCSST